MSGESNGSAARGGIGLGGAVFIVLLVLKLIGQEPVAHWSWLAVSSPLWGPAALVVGFILIAAVLATIFGGSK